MKNCLLALLLFASLCATAQVPAQMNYQGIARNSVGNVLPNKKIMVRLSVRDQGPTGNILYSEVRNVTTSSLGLFNIAIGSNGAVSATGSFATVNWNNGAKYLQVEIDPDGGTNYLNLGASPLLAVPYSLYALNAGIATPTGPAGGDLVGSYPNPTIGVDAITTAKINDAAVTNSKLAKNSVTGLKIVDSTITLSKLGPDVIAAMGGGGGGSPTGPAGGDLSGVYPNPSIGNNTITNIKLADNSVTTSKIVDASITNTKLANDAVNTANIVDASVTSAKLAAGVIPSTLPPNGPAGGDLTGTFPNPTVANNAINTNKIADNTITTSKIVDAQVTLPKLGPDVIAAMGSGGGNPTGPAGGDLSGTYPNPTIANLAITNTKIADNAITTTKLADNSVTTSKIVDASVTAAKLAAGVIPTTLPPNGPAGGDLTGTFPNPVVANNAITTTKIADNAINTNKIADNTITTSKIIDAQVTLPKLGPDVIAAMGTSGNPTGPAGGDLSGTYPNPTIANLAITTTKIADNAITTTKIADNSVTTSKIVDASVTNAKLANNAVNTTNIVDASVTAAKLAAGVIPTTLPPNGPAGGDLTGTFPNPAVANNAINTAKLADNSVTTTKIVDGNVTNAKLADNSVTTAKIVDANVTNAKLATNAVNTPNIVDASVTMPKLGPDVILFMSSGPGGPPTGPAGGDLTGTYPNPTIGNNAVTTAKIANNAITTQKIANGAVTTQEIANDAVTSQKIADNSITSTKIANNAVTNAALANNAVAAQNIINGAVTTNKIADNAITTVKILDAQVTLPKLGPDVIAAMGGGGGGSPTGPAGGDLTGTYPNPTVANLAITNAKLATNSVGTANIIDGNVTNAKLAANSVGTTNIIDASVTSAKLAAGVIPTTLPPNGPAGGDLTGTYPNPTVGNLAITTAKIADGNVTNAKLATNSVGTTNIIDASVTSAKLAAGVIPTTLPPNGPAGGDLTGTYPNPTVANLAVTNGKIADNAITTAKILDAQVTLPKLGPDVIAAMGGGGGSPTGPAGGDLTGTYPNPTVANLAVTSAKLADNSVTTAKIVDANVTTAKLADNAVTTIKLADNSVTTAKIADANVTNAKLAANSVGTSNIIDANVTNAKLAANSVGTTNIIDASVTSAKLAAGVIPTTLPPNGPAGGDLTGTYPNPVVSKLQGVGVNNTAPTNGQVLKYNGSVWTPQNDATGFNLPYAGSDNSATNSFSVTNTAAGGALEGVNSSSNANTIGVLGRISSVSAGASSTGLKGVNSSTGVNGYGVWGHHAGYGIGVYGFSVNGNGMQGNSTNGSGVFGTSTNGSAGYFDISNAANSFDGVTSYTVGTGSAMIGTSEQGNGLWGITYSGSTAGVLGYNIGGGEAVVGRNISSTAAAVVGRNDDVYGGVQGIGGADGATGVLAQANVDSYINGNALVAEIVGSSNGNPAVFKANGANVARIDKTGKGFFNGGTQVGGADVAEYFDVEGERKNYEAGDVLVISTSSDRTVEKSSTPYSTLVAGVFATKPGLMLTEKNAEQNQLDKMVPMGVIGVIPTKVCLEGGAIKRGDLIVTSSTPGVAMKADLDKVKPGQVIGKALQDYNEPGIGKINVLVSVK